MYPPDTRSTSTMVTCLLLAIVAIAGASYPGAAWQQRLACIVVAAAALGISVLEWRKPQAKPSRVKGGKRRAR